MKKFSILSIMFIIFCLLVTGCGSKDDSPVVENTQENDVVLSTNEDSSNEVSLINPEMEFWDLYNPNGFDTLTAIINNPNDVSIDVTYDLVYYKDGKEVFRNEGFANYGILPNHKDIIWANFDIPKSSDVDDIQMENMIVTPSSETLIDGTFELDGIGNNGELYYLPLLDKEPTFLSAWFVFYEDKNNNEKLDKGEVLTVETKGYELEDKWIVIEPTVTDYTNVEIYFTAY